ncbi:MAG TPA: response regulator transcription factor [Steroidobacteraceae bacterium]|nr:response regulator transcription factor [Steroidobacteraceae bacterium]
MKLLLIEDDRSAADYVAKGLRESGHSVDHAADGAEGLTLALATRYDVIVADRMLPYLDGLAVVRALRAQGSSTPILILSALAQVDDRVQGLRAGGDDYLTKPFAFAELLARIEVLQRRTAVNETPTRLRADDLEMDLVARKVTRSGHPVELTAREFRLLEYLLRHAGQVVTRTMLLENVWDLHFDPQTNVIDVHVSRLRQALDRGGARPLIHTVRGAGYVLEARD